MDKIDKNKVVEIDRRIYSRYEAVGLIAGCSLSFGGPLMLVYNEYKYNEPIAVVITIIGIVIMMYMFSCDNHFKSIVYRIEEKKFERRIKKQNNDR